MCPPADTALAWQIRPNFTDDIYGIANLTKLSDAFVMQDFYEGEFRIDPVPGQCDRGGKTDPFYTLTAIERFSGE